jgi:hypothetical protein
MTVGSVLDIQVIQRLCLAFEGDSILALIDEYVASGMEWLSKLDTALDARDCQRARFCVHGLRSPSLSIGALGVAELATIDSNAANFWDAVQQLARLGPGELEAFREEARRVVRPE